MLTLFILPESLEALWGAIVLVSGAGILAQNRWFRWQLTRETKLLWALCELEYEEKQALAWALRAGKDGLVPSALAPATKALESAGLLRRDGGRFLQHERYIFKPAQRVVDLFPLWSRTDPALMEILGSGSGRSGATGDRRGLRFVSDVDANPPKPDARARVP